MKPLVISIIGVLLTLVGGCGGGGDNAPAPQRSSSSAATPSVTFEVTPSVVSNGDIVGGTIKTYSLSSNNEWIVADIKNLSEEKTIQTSAFVGSTLLVEYRDGCYMDRSFDQNGVGRSPKQICMAPGEVLRAVVHVDANLTSVTISAFTELAASLTNYQLTHGVDLINAIRQSNDAIASWTGLDALTTSVTPISRSLNSAEPSTLYSFQLLGLGTWIRQKTYEDTSIVYGVSPYTVTSIISAMSRDISSDGQMDGLIDGLPIILGKWTVGADEFRHQVAA